MLDEVASLVVGFIAGIGTGVLAMVLVADRVARASIASAKVVVMAKRTAKRKPAVKVVH